MRQKSFTIEEAKRKLEYYCSYQERCHREVTKKLNEMNMIAAAQELIIVHLIENDFLNEERFAKAFALGKFRIKKWGRRRIVNELKAKEISSYNINSAIDEISDADYTTTFDNISIKKFGELKEGNKYKKRRKLADYLLYRGWESNLVYQKVIELIP